MSPAGIRRLVGLLAVLMAAVAIQVDHAGILPRPLSQWFLLAFVVIAGVVVFWEGLQLGGNTRINLPLPGSGKKPELQSSVELWEKLLAAKQKADELDAIYLEAMKEPMARTWDIHYVNVAVYLD